MYMKKGLFPKLLPHLIAVAVFLIVATLYCRPALEGMVVNQSDVTQWKGSIQNSIDYKATHGQYPLWTNNSFAGMPAFQIGFPANNIVPWVVHSILTLGLPVPIQFFFLACICFYFLCLALRLNPYLGIFGALSFAYATYNPVIINVGHDTKMWSIAYMPALLGGILLIYQRRYWLGAGLTALFTSVLIAMNHPQIDYYLFLVIVVMSIFFIVRWIRAAEWGHLAKALGFAMIAGAVGLLTNAVTLMSTAEYQKETIRGGASELSTPAKGDAANGLSKDYVFDYSLAIPEPLVMMFPRMYGGSSDHMEVPEEKSKAMEYLRSLGQSGGIGFYWGGLISPTSVGTSGPPYVGAVICFLAIIGFFILDDKHKWWILGATILAILMSWGKYFEGFNTFLYHSLPLYNKFRAPSMILVIPQLLLPLMAVLTLDRLMVADRAEIWPRLKKGLIGAGAFFAIALVLYLSFDFLSTQDKDTLKTIGQQNPQAVETYRALFDALKEDRQGMMLGDIFRTFGFSLAAFGLIYLLVRRTMKPVWVLAALSALTLLDLLPIDSTYLNSDKFVEKSENEAMFGRTPKDDELEADKSFYRVMNVSANPFTDAVTSYRYHSIGGYHAVKLRIYQDLIEHQLSKQQPNMAVLNMLNTKYFLQKDQNGLLQNYQRNDSAMGNAWFVHNLVAVPDAVSEMNALDSFAPRQTAFIRQNIARENGITATSFDGAGMISLVSNDNDVVTYKSSSAANQFAVFSEVYYKAGWKAFIDGKETPIARVNYVLRGLSVPAGNHEIVFRFEPPGFYRGKTLTTIFSIVMLALLAAGLFLEWRTRRDPTRTV
ncbi:MAG: hypothetical protein JWP27_1814 [Flaviaesturariibacter sp.]|nr:hypothetical protein [Flaviaesturariibacter sp.]